MTRRITCKGIDASTHEEWYRQKEAAASRLGVAELTNDEFVTLLLDVYQYHLDGVSRDRLDESPTIELAADVHGQEGQA